MRQTIQRAFSLQGEGIHSQKKSRVYCCPGRHGIEFRALSAPHLLVKAQLSTVCHTRFHVCLARELLRIDTVEHLLSACVGVNVTDLVVYIDAQELPILDGSAQEIVTAFLKAGLCPLTTLRPQRLVERPVFLASNHSYACVLPASTLSISCIIDFPRYLIQRQSYHYVHTTENYIQQIAAARTFGFLPQWNQLKAQNYARGAHFGNTLVFNESELLNPPLRFDDECVRHKILDFLALLALLEYECVGEFYLFCSGHSVDYQFLCALDSCLRKASYQSVPQECFDVLRRDFLLTTLSV